MTFFSAVPDRSTRRGPASRARGLVASACVLLLTLALGCSTYDPNELDAGLGLEALSSACGQTRGRSVLIVAITEPDLRAPSPEAAKGLMRCDVRRLEQELQVALKRVVLDEQRVSIAHVTSAGAAREALEEGFDLIVEVDVRRWNAAFVETTGAWYPNALFVGWYFWPIGAWLIADEVYGLDCEVGLSLKDAVSEVPIQGLLGHRIEVVSGEEPLREAERHEVLHPPRIVLSDGQRGLSFFGTWWPGSLEPDQWAEVSKVLQPYALRHVAVRVASAVAQAIDDDAKLNDEQRRARYATAHAVIAGVSDYPEARCAGVKNDVEAFERLLRGELTATRPPGGADEASAPALAPWLPSKNLTSLVNSRANAADLLAAVKAAAKRAREEDSLVIYLAGRGRLAPAKGALLRGLEFVDAEGNATSLADLHEAVSACRSKRRLFVFDLDFLHDAADPSPRGLPAKGVPPGQALPPALELRRALLQLLHPEDQGAVILATDLQGASRARTYDLEDSDHGMLTHYLVRGLCGAADAGQDGLTYADLEGYLERHIRNLSAVALPGVQRPLLITRDGAKAGPVRQARRK